MKKIIIEVAENSHRHHTLMKLLRQDNYIFSIENENQALRQPLVSGSVADAVGRNCPICGEPCPECSHKATDR